MTLPQALEAALKGGRNTGFKRPNHEVAVQIRSDERLIAVDAHGEGFKLKLTVGDVLADDWELVP